VASVREECQLKRLDVSPGILLAKMVEAQNANRKHPNTLQRNEIATRRKLVDWLCELGESVHLSPEGIHKAATFLDVILAENTVAEAHLQPLGIVCLLLAGKLIEKDRQVERIKTLLQTKLGIERRQIRKYEVQVLSLLKWDLQCVTAIDFAQFFASQGILFANDQILTSSGCKPPTPKVAESLRQFVEFFADMCLQEYAFVSIPPLELAAAIIAAARKALKLVHIWSHELVLLTGLSYETIVDRVELIFKCYNKLFTRSKTRLQMRDTKENIEPNNTRVLCKSRNSKAFQSGIVKVA
jgi:hypothetical protein